MMSPRLTKNSNKEEETPKTPVTGPIDVYFNSSKMATQNPTAEGVPVKSTDLETVLTEIRALSTEFKALETKVSNCQDDIKTKIQELDTKASAASADVPAMKPIFEEAKQLLVRDNLYKENLDAKLLDMENTLKRLDTDPARGDCEKLRAQMKKAIKQQENSENALEREKIKIKTLNLLAYWKKRRKVPRNRERKLTKAHIN